MFKKATRESAKLRLALTGPAGSGKTYSSLQIAKGLGGRIAMIDTERGSGALYANIVDYDVLRIDPPFEPKKFLEGIKAAEDAGYDVLIIDSLSHAWAGDGGILTIHDRTAKAVRNSFDAWREVTPVHNQLVDAILASTCHVIVTMRTKTGYEVTTESGKTKVSKVGLAPIQRDGLEYEFTVVMDLSIEGHVATASKDRTGLFDSSRLTPTPETGKKVLEWLEGSGISTETVEKPGLKTLMETFGHLGIDDLQDEYTAYICERYGVSGMDEINASQTTEQITMLKQCLAREEKMSQFADILRDRKLAA
ncbi:ATP-binding protein [Fundidesulfovibrio soli]|uniref:ATP-binding protein n=1 Tax=Fundidesulfovibrio soli TaxID=2922716 RepID=UPI001FAF0143|nr:ATP-binding protein [Fundidesulfovibrio soli]